MKEDPKNRRQTMNNTPLLLGIDAGNSRMKMAVCDPQGNPTLLHNDCGEPYTPSVIYFAPEGGVLVGTQALNASFTDPGRVVTNWKRHMGTDNVLYTADDGKEYRAEDILQILLERCRNDFVNKMGQDPEDVVISVPANYTDPQKEATQTAARNAGLNVLRLIHEPTAAALGNSVHRRGANLSVIYDLGGGTFDISVVQAQGDGLNVIATGGEARLGGESFNSRMEAMLLEKFEGEHGYCPDRDKHLLFFQEATCRIEQAKVVLSSRPEATVAVTCEGKLCSMPVTRQQFEEACGDLVAKTVERVKQTLAEVGLQAGQIDEILLVGGASRMPMVAAALPKLFGKPPQSDVEPDYAAAYGNLIACRIDRERQGRPLVTNNVALPPLRFRYGDVTAHPIGVCVLDDEKMLNHVLLDKGKPFPSEHTEHFRLAEANQTDALVEILQGPKSGLKDKCAMLGHFELTSLPPQSDTQPRIEVLMRIDINGILSARARDTISGKSAELEIDYKNHTVSPTSA